MNDDIAGRLRERVCDLHWAYLERHSRDPQGEDAEMHTRLAALIQWHRTEAVAAEECYRKWCSSGETDLYIECDDLKPDRARCPSCEARATLDALREQYESEG